MIRINRNKIKKNFLALAVILFVLTVAITALVRIPFPSITMKRTGNSAAGVYATLGDMCIYMSVLLLGTPWGVVVSAAGAALADILVGSKLYIIGSLMVKTAMALFLSAFCVKCDDWKKSIVVAAITEGIMVLGYFVYDLVIVGEFIVAGKALLVNLGQGVVCGALGAVILHYIPPVRPEKMPEIKRARRASPREDTDEDLWQD